MAKINTGTITAAGNGTWSSDAITLTAGSKRVYMRVNGTEVLYRDFTVQAAIAQDGSTVQGNQGYGTTMTTAGLTTSGAGRLIILGVTIGGSTDTTPATVSGSTMGSSGWTLLHGAGSGSKWCGIYAKVASGSLSGETFTVTWSGSNTGFITATALTGAVDPSTKTANVDYRTASSTGTGTTPSTSGTTIGTSGSWVIAQGMHWQTTQVTATANTSILAQNASNNTSGMWTMKQAASSLSAGSFTADVTATVSQSWRVTMAEILAA